MFFNLLKTDLKRGIFNWGTLGVALALLGISIATPVTVMIRYPQSIFNGIDWLLHGSAQSSLAWIFSAFCAIPYAMSYSDEVHTGYRNAILMRAGYRRYAWSKLIAASVSAAAAFALWYALFWAFCMAFNTAPTEYLAEDIQYISRIAPSIASMLNTPLALSYFLNSLLWTALNAVAWSGVAMAIAAYIPNRYITIAGPFLLHNLMIYIFFGLGISVPNKLFYFFMPDIAFMLLNSVIGGFLGYLTLLLVLTASSWFLFYRRGQEVLARA